MTATNMTAILTTTDNQVYHVRDIHEAATELLSAVLEVRGQLLTAHLNGQATQAEIVAMGRRLQAVLDATIS